MAFWDKIAGLWGKSQLFDIVIRNNTNSAIYPDTNSTYYVNTFTQNGDVFSVINKICEPASRVPVLQVNKKTLEDQPGKALDLISRPNPFQSQQEFIYSALVMKLLFGETFVCNERPEFGLNAGKPVRLDLMPPQWTEIQIGTFKEPIIGYTLNIGQTDVKYLYQDVMHWREFNPDFQLTGEHLRGLSKLRPLLRAAMTSSSGYDSMVSAFQNQGAYGLLTVLGVKESDGKYSGQVRTQEQLSALKTTWQNENAGNTKRGKLALTNKSVEWTPFGLTPVDLNILKSMNLSQGKICDAYNYPFELMAGSEQKTYSNYGEAMKAAWNNAIIPVLDGYYQKLSDWLLPMMGEEDTMFMPNYDSIPALQDDKAQLVAWMTKAGLTTNEIREALGYDPLNLPNMDVPLVAMGQTRIDEIGMAPSAEVAENALKYFTDYRK